MDARGRIVIYDLFAYSALVPTMVFIDCPGLQGIWLCIISCINHKPKSTYIFPRISKKLSLYSIFLAISIFPQLALTNRLSKLYFLDCPARNNLSLIPLLAEEKNIPNERERGGD